MLFADLGSVRIVKNCDPGPENVTLGQSFSLYGPPIRQIAYTCFISKLFSGVKFRAKCM